MTERQINHTPQDAGFPYLVKKEAVMYGAEKITIATGDKKPRDYVSVDFFPSTREFKIQYIKSGIPRSGIGKKLLRRALKEAQKIGAERVTATIINRECLTSMQQVFGENSVAVKRLGEYGRINSADARLDYPLNSENVIS